MSSHSVGALRPVTAYRLQLWRCMLPLLSHLHLFCYDSEANRCALSGCLLSAIVAPLRLLLDFCRPGFLWRHVGHVSLGKIHDAPRAVCGQQQGHKLAATSPHRPERSRQLLSVVACQAPGCEPLFMVFSLSSGHSKISRLERHLCYLTELWHTSFVIYYTVSLTLRSSSARKTS